MARESITTLVLYHPQRPIGCLLRNLESLRKATAERDLLVECFVQGPLPEGTTLPKPATYREFKLVYHHRPFNTGMSIALTESIVRCLGMGRTWWTKLDDDIILPPLGWDSLIQIIRHERKVGRFALGCAMFGGSRVGPPKKQAPPTSDRDGFLMDVRARGSGRAPELVITRGYHALRDLGDLEYAVCDFVDNGCTVFDSAVFRSGCLPDPRYFLGAVNTDFVWQMLRKGWKSAYVTKPQMDHVHKPCNPYSYRKAKEDNIRHQHQAGRLFLIKWGIEDTRLTNRKAVKDKDGLTRAG